MATYVDYSDCESVVTDVNAINNSIRNILLTKRGSLPGKPRFGSDLATVIFSKIDHLTVSALKRSIQEALNEFEPRILIDSTTIKEIPEYNRLVAHIKYRYRDSGLVVDGSTSITIE